MQLMTEIEFLYEMKRLISLYRTNMTDEEIMSWYDRFKNVDYEIFDKVVKRVQ